VSITIAELRPAPVDLGAALARLDATSPAAGPAAESRLGLWLAARLARSSRLAVPRADLALLGQSPETFLVRKVTAGLAGLGSFAIAGALLSLLGVGVPWAVPAFVAVAAGAAMFFLPDADVHNDAARRRRDFRYAWSSYLQLVQLARTAGAGPSEALESAAEIGSGWVFTRIRDALLSARAAHDPLWQGLARLGEEIGAAEVSELADTIRGAGNEGTRIAATLAASAESLRTRLLTDLRARANSRTATMIIPLTPLGLGLILLMIFPAFYSLLAVGP
jgi:Flp pilus assembly protein TadB